MLASLLLPLAVLTVRGRFNDPDLWWHLKTGEVIWTTHTIPATDLFSWTTNHHAWIPHEWLAQMSLYGMYHWDGYTALMLWFCVVTAFLILSGYALCSLYSGDAKTAFLGALVVWLFSTTVFSIRPQLSGYLFLILELLLIQLGRTRNSGWFFVLPPLFLIWVNCHGSFFLGLLVLMAFLFCSFLQFHMGLLVSQVWDPRCRRSFMVAFLLSVAALFFNPGGVRQLLYPLNTLFHQHIVTSQIDEWKPLQLSDPRGFALLCVLGCILLALLLRRSDLYLHEFLLLVLGTVLALDHQRMAVVFGILAAPVLSRLLASESDRSRTEKDRPLLNAAMIAASIAVAILAFPGVAVLERQVEAGNPIQAVKFIRDTHLQGPMLNAFNYGGYLIWALPEQPVFLDGRADVYEWTGVLDQVSNWANLQSDPNDLLDRYHVHFCLLERNSAMARVLTLLPGWKLLYSDDRSVIFARTAGAS